MNEERFLHDINGVVNELEIALCIDGEDYASRDIVTTIERIKQRIQQQYAIDLTGPMDAVYAPKILGDEVKTFLDNLFFMYNKMAGCASYIKYSKVIPLRLTEINYLGKTKESMLAVLKMLQREGQQHLVAQAMEEIKARIVTIPMCLAKKLFLLLYVSYMLELYELTAIIAEILYIGGK